MKTKPFAQIGIDIDYFLANSKDIKQEIKHYIPKIAEYLHISESEATKLARFHIVNITAYHEHFYANEATYKN